MSSSILPSVEKISVLMPIRNGSRFLNQAMSFVTSNVLPCDEVVVVNDFSTDNTLMILKKWAESDPRVKIVENSSPGLVNALNLGIQACSNDWIARFDVDDKYSLHRLSSQRSLVNLNTAAIFTDYCFTTEGGSSLGRIPSAVTDFGIRISLLQGRRTAHPSVLFNKPKVLLAGNYKQEDFPAEDLGLWLRLTQFGEFSSVPEVHLNYTISQGSVTVSKRLESQKKKNQVVNNHIAKNGKLKVTLGNLREMMDVYRELPDGINRYLHFCLDVVLSRKHITMRSKTILGIFCLFLLCCIQWQGLKFCRLMIQDYLLRRKFRKSLL